MSGKERTCEVVANVRICAFLIAMVSMVSGYADGVHAKGHIAEALMKIGFAYMVALVVACSSAIWSVVVEKRHAATRVGGTTAIRLFVLFVLFALFGPLVIMIV